jgi:hypothetical protein
MNHPPAPPQRRRAARRTPRTRRTLARLGGLAAFLAAAIGVAPAAWATSPPPAPSAAPPPAAAPAHFPPWAIAAILAATVVPSVATTLITLALEHTRRACRAPAAAARRCVIGAAVCGAVISAVVLGVMLGTVRPRAPADSGVAGCTALLSGHQVTAADYPRIRSEFTASQWPDLRAAGTSYVDLAVKLRTARHTDGYETVSFYQRLTIACARHDQNVTADRSQMSGTPQAGQRHLAAPTARPAKPPESENANSARPV